MERAERILIVPQWEARGAEGWAVYVEQEDGQIALVGTIALGPFDTVGVVTQKVVRLLVDSPWRVK
jgi:hypothetical protein